MIVLLNPRAGGGHALNRWDAISPLIHDLVGPFRVCTTEAGVAMRDRIASLLAEGEHHFIAAGGDGTVNLVLNNILANAGSGLPPVTLGAIGLGSSNDFHKPMLNGRLLKGIPFRLDFSRPKAQDVAVVRYEDADGQIGQRYWIINASVGVHRPRPMHFAWDNLPSRVFQVSSLALVRKPLVPATPPFSVPCRAESGGLLIHLVQEVGVMGLARVLLGFARARCGGRWGAISWPARCLTIRAADPFPLETDGELVLARKARFTVLPRALHLCS